MKNILTAFYAVCILITGCNREDNLENTNSDNEEQIKMEFTATIESDGPTTRTQLGGDEMTKVFWLDTDEVQIGGAIYSVIPNTDDPSTATLKFKSGELAEPPYIAYYPTSIANSCLPATQTYNGSDLSAVAPMFAYSETKELSFKNICSVLEIILKGDDDTKIKSITVEDTEKAMSGNFILDENFNAIVDDEESKAGVTLDCGANGVALSDDGTKFYIAVPPAEYAALKITITDINDKSWSVSAKKAASMQRNNIYSMTFSPTFKTYVTWTKFADYSGGSLNGLPYIRGIAGHTYNGNYVTSQPSLIVQTNATEAQMNAIRNSYAITLDQPWGTNDVNSSNLLMYAQTNNTIYIRTTADAIKMTTCGGLLYDLTSLRYVNLNGLDVSDVTDFTSAFQTSIQPDPALYKDDYLDIRDWDTRKATDMSKMFSRCLAHTIYLPKKFTIASNHENMLYDWGKNGKTTIYCGTQEIVNALKSVYTGSYYQYVTYTLYDYDGSDQ